MGYAVAVATAIVALAAFTGAMRVADAAFDESDTLQETWMVSQDRAYCRNAGDIDIVDVNTGGGDTLIEAENVGDCSLDVFTVTVVINGALRVVEDIEIDGEADNQHVWAPFTTAEITVTGQIPVPQDVAISTSNGVMGFWRN